MISALDIRERAGEWGLSPDVVEKDYVLGRTFVFKGGTCLKKCHFETYRFSEDLDFTLVEGAPADPDSLASAFTRVARRLEDVIGLELPPDRFRFDVYENPRGRPSIEGRIYWAHTRGGAAR